MEELPLSLEAGAADFFSVDFNETIMTGLDSAAVAADASVSHEDLTNASCDALRWIQTADGHYVPVEFEMFYCIPSVAPIFGYVIPVIALVGLITNLMASLVLLRAEMRTPTNLILLAIGTANTLTACSPIPAYAYFYTMGNYVRLIPASWCMPYRVLLDYLPTTFHTIAIWLTTCLALQRYVYVCQPDYVNRFCSNRVSVLTTLGIAIVSSITHCPRLFEFSCEETVVNENGVTHFVSTRSLSEWLITGSSVNNEYFTIQTWMRCIFINVIPCTLLFVLTGILLRKVRQTANRRRRLVKRKEIQALEDSNRLTIMLVVVVTIFLSVEVPSGIFTILSNLNAVQTKQGLLVTQLIINVCILVSYPINFFVYCAMSRQFRTIFVKKLLPCSLGANSTKSTTKTTNLTETTERNALSVNGCDVRSNGSGTAST